MKGSKEIDVIDFKHTGRRRNSDSLQIPDFADKNSVSGRDNRRKVHKTDFVIPLGEEQNENRPRRREQRNSTKEHEGFRWDRLVMFITIMVIIYFGYVIYRDLGI